MQKYFKKIQVFTFCKLYTNIRIKSFIFWAGYDSSGFFSVDWASMFQNEYGEL